MNTESTKNNLTNNTSENQWTEVISSKSHWWDIRLGELWRYRDLIGLFVWRDFVSVYKQTILGPLWHIIQPVLTTIVFTIVFGAIAKIPTENTPPFLFYLAGNTFWNYFASCLNRTSNTFVGNAQIFGKVYFPRMTVPVSNVISALLSLGIQFTLFVCVYAGYMLTGTTLTPTIWLLGIPYFVFIMAILGLGLGIIISSLTTKYRDLTFLVAFGVQLFMYATPIIFPLSVLSPNMQYYLSFNPLTPLVEGFRYAFFGVGTFDVWSLGYATLITFIIFFLGLALFHQTEKNFMDTV